MKSMIKLLLVGGILFGLSYAGSSFLLVSKKTGEEEVVDTSAAKNPASDSPVSESSFSVEADRLAGKTDEAPLEKVDSMPVSLQSEQPLSIESVLQLADSIRKKEKQLDEREKIVIRDEQRVKLMFGDVQQEQKELNALGDRVDAKIMAARELLGKLQQERSELADVKKTAGKPAAGGAPTADEAALQSRVAATIDVISNLSDDVAANYIRDFANSGDLEFASRLMNSLDVKKQVKILSAINDVKLGQQLMQTSPKQ